MDSKFQNRRRARQLIDFANIRIGEKGMPTDCDGLIEYHDKAYVLFELKHGDKDVPLGQWLALVRMCDDFARIGKPATFIIAEHDVDDPDVDIDAAACLVRKYYFKGRWYTPIKPVTLKENIDSFIRFVDRRNSLEQSHHDGQLDPRR